MGKASVHITAVTIPFFAFKTNKTLKSHSHFTFNETGFHGQLSLTPQFFFFLRD